MLRNLSIRIRACHERAVEARERAHAISDPEEKAWFLKMEESWMRLARSYELNDRLDNFINTRLSKRVSRHFALISIVDDDEHARGGIQALVESLGYNAAGFRSAEAFLRSNVAASTACLITDLHMPKMNGLELLEAMRSRGPHMPFIVITAYPNEKHRARALDSGAIAFLSKPVDEQSLIECLSVAFKSAD